MTDLQFDYSKKRNFNENGDEAVDDSSKKKKKAFEEPRSGEELKNLLADSGSSSAALKWLASLNQDSRNAKLVVSEYCQQAGDYTGILRYLSASSSESPKRKVQACAAAEGILLMLSGDDEEEPGHSHADKESLTKFATAICSHDCLRALVTLLLSRSNGPKAVLKLLTALVVTSSATANLLITNFNWDLFKKNIAEPVNDLAIIRSCLAYLSIALLLHAEEQNETVVTAAITTKARFLFDILFSQLGKIAEDDQQLAQLIVDTLLKKICENAHITKTTKMKLFTEQNTEHLLRLFAQPTTSTELSEITQSLLRRLFTDTKLGVVFVDPKFGTTPGSTASTNANVLATKIITFLITQTNPGLLELLVEILTACPDQIPHYLEQLAAHVKKPEVLLVNAGVIAQLPPATSYLPKNVSPNSPMLAQLTALCLPQSSIFLDVARAACKSGSKHWEVVNPAISLSAALLTRCTHVFSFLSASWQRVLCLFFWRVKRCFVDPDKVLRLAFSATEWLKNKTNDASTRRYVIAALCSCMAYLKAFLNFSPLLVLSYKFDKLISQVLELAKAKANHKLRKPLARLCLTIGLSLKWQTEASNIVSEDSLIGWIIEEASSSPEQYALSLAEIFIKLSGVESSQGEIAAYIVLIGRQEEAEDEIFPSKASLLVHLFECLCLAAKKNKPASSMVPRRLRSVVPDNCAFAVSVESLSTLLSEEASKLSLQNGNSLDQQAPLTRLMGKSATVGYDFEEIKTCIDAAFPTSSSKAVNEVFTCMFMNWLLHLCSDSEVNSARLASVGSCLSLLFKHDDRNVPYFLRALATHPTQLASVENICNSPVRHVASSAIQTVCRFIRSNPDHVSVCLARLSGGDDNLCKFSAQEAVSFVKKSLTRKSAVSSPLSVGIVASLCQRSDDINEVANVVAKRALKSPDDIEKLTSLMRMLVSEINSRGELVGSTFVDFTGRFVLEGDDDSSPVWQESAELLYEIVASPRKCIRSLRSLFLSAPLKSLKRLVDFWQRHEGLSTYPLVATFVGYCVVTLAEQSKAATSPKSRQRLVDLIATLLAAVPQKSHVATLLCRCVMNCLTSAATESDAGVSLGQLLSVINNGEPVFSRQSELLILLNHLSSASAAEKVETQVAVQAVTSLLRSVQLPLSSYHQSFMSILSSLLSWAGVNNSTMTTVAEACASVDIGSMKTRHKNKLISWLMEACQAFEGSERWLANAYVTPAVVQCLFSTPELITDDARSLIDATESLLFDEFGNPHDHLLKSLTSASSDQGDMMLRCLHSLLWFRGPSWRGYNSVWRGVVPVLLENYSATLSHRDQLILSCLAAFDNCFDSFEAERSLWPPYQPCIWGARSKKMTASRANQTEFSLASLTQSADVVLECLSSNSVLSTALNFPLDRGFVEIEKGIIFKTDDCSSSNPLYDPAFLLPVFVRTFSTPNCSLTLSRFVSSNVLSYLLAALSLKDDRLRAIAYTALSLFENIQKRQRKPSQPLIQFLKTVRLSIHEANTRVAPVMATFLARLPGVLFGHKTASALSKPVNQYMNGSSSLQIAAANKPTVPSSIANSFYYPSDIENAKNQRSFLLEIASTGLRDLEALNQSRDGVNLLPMLSTLLNSPLCGSAAEFLLVMKLLADLGLSSEAAVHKLVRVHRMHLLVPTFASNKYVLESGSRPNIDRNKASAAELTRSLRRSLSKGGVTFSVTL